MRARTDRLEIIRPILKNATAAFVGKVGDQGINHPANGFVYHASILEIGKLLSDIMLKVSRKNACFGNLVQRNQTRSQTIVYVVVVVGNFIGKIRELGFQRWLVASARIAHPIHRVRARWHANSV